MQRYVLWILWKYKIIFLTFIVYVVVRVFSPQFAAFSLILVPVLLMGANMLLSLFLVSDCEERHLMPLSCALEVSLYILIMLVFGALLSGRHLIQIVPPDTISESVVFITVGTVAFGFIVGMIEHALCEYHAKSSGEH